MNAVSVRVVRTEDADPEVPLPSYQTEGAAGLDVSANLAPGDRANGFLLQPGERCLVPTGLRVQIPEGYEIQMRPRSGLALKQGLTLVNTPGTIDSDYRGEIGVIVINNGAQTVAVTHGMRIAQMVLAPVTRLVWQEADQIGASDRGEGGFGSTGTDPESTNIAPCSGTQAISAC
jgi:dUTP pyrophosphatase